MFDPLGMLMELGWASLSPLGEHIRPCALNSSKAARAGEGGFSIATTET